VERWKKQFDFLEPRETETKQVAFGGYTGYFFKGVGKLKDEQAMVLAWSLQLPQESFRALTLAEDPVMDRIYGQMRSDVTIKAVGPMELIAKRRNEIEKFANSFHLIREIPSS
jgi:hypothetical protein